MLELRIGGVKLVISPSHLMNAAVVFYETKE
jgi:hypothetical protein